MKRAILLALTLLFICSTAFAAKFIKIPLTFSQNLASAALSYTTSISRNFRLDEVTIKFSTPITETVTLTRDSRDGSNYDVVLVSESLTSESSFVFRPHGECNFYDGDELKVQVTNNTTTGVAYGQVRASEIN